MRRHRIAAEKLLAIATTYIDNDFGIGDLVTIGAYEIFYPYKEKKWMVNAAMVRYFPKNLRDLADTKYKKFTETSLDALILNVRMLKVSNRIKKYKKA